MEDFKPLVCQRSVFFRVLDRAVSLGACRKRRRNELNTKMEKVDFDLDFPKSDFGGVAAAGSTERDHLNAATGAICTDRNEEALP